MHTVNIHEAKTHLSRLIEEALNGEPFIIAKAGKPLVKVIAISAPLDKQIRRLGFMKGEFNIPEHFDTLCAQEIEDIFG